MKEGLKLKERVKRGELRPQEALDILSKAEGPVSPRIVQWLRNRLHA